MASSTYLKTMQALSNGLALKYLILHITTCLYDANIRRMLKYYMRFSVFLFFNIRCIWFVIVLASFVCASFLVHIMWLKFNSSPTITAVKDTHLALYSLPFPAINVCPMQKIKRSIAYEYVTSRINGSYQEFEMDNFLNGLTLFQHPLYNRMIYYLNHGIDDFLSRLSDINITHFMLTVRLLPI